MKVTIECENIADLQNLTQTFEKIDDLTLKIGNLKIPNLYLMSQNYSASVGSGSNFAKSLTLIYENRRQN